MSPPRGSSSISHLTRGLLAPQCAQKRNAPGLQTAVAASRQFSFNYGKASVLLQVPFDSEHGSLSPKCVKVSTWPGLQSLKFNLFTPDTVARLLQLPASARRKPRRPELA